MAVTLKDLRKPTLAETFLSLQQLLYSESALNLSKLVDSRLPHDWDAFDQSLRLSIVDKTENSEELSRILFETDSGVIRRAVKCKWFFKKAPVIFFTDEVLPVVSVSTRLKVISALSKGKTGDDAVCLFEWVRRNFGLRVAEPLLVSCPREYIEKILLGDVRPIGDRTFLAVARRLPELAVKIMGLWKNSTRRRDVPYSVIRRLALSPALFVDWEDDRLVALSFKIGRKLLRSWKNRLEQIGPKAAELLSQHQEPRFFRSLPHDVQVKYMAQLVSCVPSTSRTTLKQWNKEISRFDLLIRKMDSSNRDRLLHDAFLSVFGQDLWNAKEALVPELLELLSHDQRQLLLQKFQLNGEEYIYLKPAEQAVPILIQKVKQCSEAAERCKLVESMVKSCILAWNLPQLEYVISYVTNHHKNSPAVLHRFLESGFPIHLISLDACRSITQIATTEHSNFNKPLLRAHENYLARLLEASLPMDDALSLWLNFVNCFNWRLPLLQKPNKNLFLVLYKFLPRILQELDKNSYSYYHCVPMFLEALVKFKINPEELPDKGNLLCKHLDNCTEFLWKSRILQFYNGDELVKIIAQHSLLPEFLRFRPEFVQENIAQILNQFLENWCYISYQRFFGTRHILKFYKLDQKIAKFCEEKFTIGTIHNKIMLLRIYSFVAEIEDFQRLAGDYLVNGPRINTSSNDAEIKIRLPSYLKNLQPIGRVFPLVRGCLLGGGDLLYPALSTFLKACYNSPVEEAVKEVIPLLESPVSVMKKAVGILAAVCTRDEAVRIFDTAWKNARHYSARTVLLERLLGLFVDDPSDETWKGVEQCIVQSDAKLLLAFPSFESIPDNYIRQFSSIFWNALDQCQGVETVRKRLVSELTDCVHLLSNELCEKIITHWFLLNNSFVDTFTVKYLARGESELAKKLQFIENIVKLRLDAYPRGFIDFVLTIAYQDLSDIFPFLSEFIACLETILTRVDLYEARWPLLYLQFLQSAIQRSGKMDCDTLRSVGQQISALWMSEPDRNGLHPLLANSLKVVFRVWPLLAVVSGIVCDDPAVNIAVLLSMDHGGCTREDLTEAVLGDDAEVLHKYVLYRLSQCQNDAVQTYLSEFLALENRKYQFDSMTSCVLSGDYKSLEKVCLHVAAHHRNDKDVLYTWPESAQMSISATQSITLDTWKAVMDIAGLIHAQTSSLQGCSVLVKRYASALAARNEDPVPVLERLAEWDEWFYSEKYCPDLKQHVVKIMLDKINKKCRFAEMMAVQLFNEGERGINKFAENLEPRGENCSLILFQAMWKDSENRDIIRRWFEKLPLTGSLIDWFWRKDPGLFKSNMQRVVESLIGEEKMTWFEKDHRLLSFYELNPDFLQKCKDSRSRKQKTSQQNMKDDPNFVQTSPIEGQKNVLARSPLPAVLTLSSKAVSNSQLVFTVLTVASYDAGTEFLKAHRDELTCPLAARWSLRFAWRQFRDLPRDANWDLLKEMSYRCDAHSVRRVLGMVDAPSDWMGHVSRLVWDRVSTETKVWKEKFLKSIPSDRIALLDPDVRVQLLQNITHFSGNAHFIFKCWWFSPDDNQVNQIIRGFFLEWEFFEDKFVKAIMNQAVTDGLRSIPVLEKTVNLKFRPNCVWQLTFLKVFLTNELNSFPGLVLKIFEGEKDELVCWPLMADALSEVIKVTEVPLFWFIRNLVRSSSRTGLILGVYLLPKRVHHSGCFVIDPDAQVYEDIIEILKRCQDRVVLVYLHKHLNCKIAV